METFKAFTKYGKVELSMRVYQINPIQLEDDIKTIQYRLLNIGTAELSLIKKKQFKKLSEDEKIQRKLFIHKQELNSKNKLQFLFLLQKALNERIVIDGIQYPIEIEKTKVLVSLEI